MMKSVVVTCVAFLSCLGLLLFYQTAAIGNNSHGAINPNDVVDLWLYSHVQSSNTSSNTSSKFLDFVGADELHMTDMNCVGVYPKNKTCLFKNIYYDGVNTETGKPGKYLIFVPITKAQISVLADLKAKALAAAQVSLPSYNPYWSKDEWYVDVVFFERVRKVGAVPRSLVHQWLSSQLSGGQDGNASNLASACNWTHANNGSDPIQCLSPRVSLIVTRPMFLVVYSVYYNIAHWLWDDVISWWTAMNDFGHQDHNSVQLLLMQHPAVTPPPDWEDSNTLVKQTYRGISHDYQPVSFRRFQSATQGKIVMFRTLLAGLMARGTHAFHVNYTAYGIPQSRVIWSFRQHYVKGFGLSHLDNDWTKHPAPPFRVVILQKKEKRVIQNLTTIVSHMKEKFPEAAFQVLSWEDLGGHAHEVETLISTHVFISADGTGADTVFLLPKGAVFISLGVATQWGSGNMADNIFAGMDHIRVLYFDGLPRGSGHEMQSPAPLIIRPTQLEPFVRRALQLVKDGFSVPVPFLTNHSPNGRMCYRLFHYYPELADIAGKMWLTGQPCDRLRHISHQMYKEYIGREPPDDFDDVIQGRLGWPPGPDLNEVSGFAPDTCPT